MPSGNHIRNIITLLLILTLTNLVASFAAFYAVRSVRDDSRARIERIDAAINHLTNVAVQLCTQRPDVCACPATRCTGQVSLGRTSSRQVARDPACPPFAECRPG